MQTWTDDRDVEEPVSWRLPLRKPRGFCCRCSCFWDKVSCTREWPVLHYVSKDNMNFWSPCFECWDCRRDHHILLVRFWGVDIHTRGKPLSTELYLPLKLVLTWEEKACSDNFWILVHQPLCWRDLLCVWEPISSAGAFQWHHNTGCHWAIEMHSSQSLIPHGCHMCHYVHIKQIDGQHDSGLSQKVKRMITSWSVIYS